MMRNGLITVVVLVGITLSLNAQTEETPTEISFERSISQTSVWPGDRVHYLITLTAAPDVKIATEDFDLLNVSFEPFYLIDMQHSEELVGGQVRHVFDYLLANYEIGDRQVEIPGLIFRYQTPGPTEANAPTMEEMQIPPMPMSVRSTLNQPLSESWILESLPVSQVPIRSWVPLVAGLGGLLVSSLPLGVWVWKKVPDWQARRRQLSRKQFLNQCSVSLGQLEKRLSNNNAEIKDHYHDLEQLVGKYIHYFWDIQAQGLTHAELAARLKPGQLLPKQSEALTGVLEHGQSCRYAPDSSAGWEDTLRQDLQQIKKMCA
ncbi:MAG: hypothetical protein O7D93_11250 [Acidobacteria bacterium]|nr:hypothetical protein [Acidobacteriota bacterium]